MATVVFNAKVGEIECVRSLRARSIRLSVKSNGSLRLVYPLFTPRSRAIAFVENKAEWITKTRKRLAEHRETMPTITRSELEHLRREARLYLPAAIERIAREHGFRYTTLRISSARTRWGSCSGKNGISLSLFVMLLPEHLREFIILHELCHTHHHNHSAAFHNLLNAHVGGKEKALNRELKTFKIPCIEE